MRRSKSYYAIKYITEAIVAIPLIIILSVVYGVPVFLAIFVCVLAGGSVGRSIAELLVSSGRQFDRSARSERTEA
jgi:hypothetical protein